MADSRNDLSAQILKALRIEVVNRYVAPLPDKWYQCQFCGRYATAITMYRKATSTGDDHACFTCVSLSVAGRQWIQYQQAREEELR